MDVDDNAVQGQSQSVAPAHKDAHSAKSEDSSSSSSSDDSSSSSGAPSHPFRGLPLHVDSHPQLRTM